MKCEREVRRVVPDARVRSKEVSSDAAHRTVDLLGLRSPGAIGMVGNRRARLDALRLEARHDPLAQHTPSQSGPAAARYRRQGGARLATDLVLGSPTPQQAIDHMLIRPEAAIGAVHNLDHLVPKAKHARRGAEEEKVAVHVAGAGAGRLAREHEVVVIE